jgi:hypothetical protein
MSRGKQTFQLRELLAIDDLYFARGEMRNPILYSARGEVIHFCRVGIAHLFGRGGSRRWAMPTLRWLTQRRAEYNPKCKRGNGFTPSLTLREC